MNHASDYPLTYFSDADSEREVCSNTTTISDFYCIIKNFLLSYKQHKRSRLHLQGAQILFTIKKQGMKQIRWKLNRPGWEWMEP